MLTYQEVFAKNKKWIESKKEGNSSFFDHLALGQNPAFLYIGCSDSRVSAEQMMGAEPGEVFVHRNIANVVNSNDLSALSVIEYAVEHLKVKHLVVCGHYECGGIAAAMKNEDAGLLNPWLQNIKDVHRLHKEELDGIADSKQRYERLIEINVEEQCLNLYKTAVVQKALNSGHLPSIHGWIFDIKTGALMDLNLDIEKKAKDLKIYELK